MRVILNDDKVWFDSKNKLQEICDEVQTESASGKNVLVLSHFPVIRNIALDLTLEGH